MKIKVEIDIDFRDDCSDKVDCNTVCSLEADSYDNIYFELPKGIKFTVSGDELIRAVQTLQSVGDYCDDI